MKNLVNIILLLFVTISNAQLYINVEQANQISSADLQLDSNNKGIGMPILNLVSVNDYSPIRELPKDGLLVYNNNVTDDLQIGYYYWRSLPTAHWEKVGGERSRNTIIQNVNEYVLGYNPNGLGANAPASIDVIDGNNNSGIYNKTRCIKWDKADGGNGHTYCGYKSNNTTRSFEHVYNATRKIGGYIVTVTSDAEWNFVKNNIMYDGLFRGGDNLLGYSWLGYTSVATPGNRVKEYMWITGETWDSNWGNVSSTQSHFANVANNPEPATVNYSRCTVIGSTGNDAQYSNSNPNREWFTRPCSTGQGVINIIVEFNQ